MQLELVLNDTSEFPYETKTIVNFERSILDGIQLLNIEVAEPVIGQNYGYGADDISKFFLSSRYNLKELHELKAFPMQVHVFFLKDPKKKDPESFEDLYHWIWAELRISRSTILESSY
jgi:hypothetical protein